MSKISEKLARALMNKEEMKSGSSEVWAWSDDDIAYMVLYGTKIAMLEGDTLFVRTGGQDTKTTKDRLNALPGVQINTKKGDLYLNGKLWENTHKWTIVE